MMKTKSFQDFAYEVPVQFVEGFGEIKFGHHARLFSNLEGVNDFVGQNNSIQDLTSFDITFLFRRNKGGKEWFETIGYDFGNNFVEDIAKSNRPKLVRGGDNGFLGNESEKGSIEGWENLLITP